MANPEHVEHLRKGKSHWNALGIVKPDLSGADLSMADLGGFQLTDADLSLTTLTRANLTGAFLQRARLVGADLRWTQLWQCNLSSADLSDANLDVANVSEAVCPTASFRRTRARGTLFRSADLRRADFSNSNLSGADFYAASLADAKFFSARLMGANLVQAVLQQTAFHRAAFGYTILDGTDLSGAIGLDDVQHRGPSYIDVTTILSEPRLTDTFLKGLGLPEPFIAYHHSLSGTSSPFQFYSCFISHSSRDSEFCQRLYTDLQAAGVRCWYAPEDLKIGDRFRHRIDESIRVFDKLLIVLSEDSLRSTWVEQEVEAAFDKERAGGRTVLFPLRVDDAILATDEAWAATVRRTRQIGDFSRWKDHDQYRAAFTRLMRDLQAPEPGTPPAIAK